MTGDIGYRPDHIRNSPWVSRKPRPMIRKQVKGGWVWKREGASGRWLPALPIEREVLATESRYLAKVRSTVSAYWKRERQIESRARGTEALRRKGTTTREQVQALTIANEGVSTHNLAGIIARKLKISPHRVRQIWRKENGNL